MSLLAHHPEVVSKIREEISIVLGDRQAKYEDIKNLPYCDSVLKETLRMRPPVPLLDRAVGEDCELNGQTYKKGVSIINYNVSKLIYFFFKDLCISSFHCCTFR